jgi:DNA polymerase III alpha subunit
MTRLYRFACGCSWPVLEENTPDGVIPLLDFDVSQAPDDCPAVWEMLGRGLTKGVFQLESSLGRQWCKRLMPESCEHMGALGALLRPGCLKAVDEEGVSMTQHYARRKNGEEDVAGFHPAIDPILSTTYNVLTFQEQMMFIARDVAGFDLVKMDKLRKAVGKKDQKELSAVRDMFLEGAKKAAVLTEEQAATVWGWIQQSGRYAFNRSHAVSYGLTGYDSAYIKAHFPLAFYTAWLRTAKQKPDPQLEVRELVDDARVFGVDVQPPDLTRPEPHTHTDRRVVRFGLGDVKGVGGVQVQRVIAAVRAAEEKLGKPLSACGAVEFLLWVAAEVSSTVLKNLVMAGAARWLGADRQRLLAEYDVFSRLTDKEVEWLRRLPGVGGLTFERALALLAPTKKAGGGTATAGRREAVLSYLALLQNPPTSLGDSPAWLAWAEEQVLGVALTASRVDSCDLSQVNATCKEVVGGRTGFMLLGVEVKAAREFRTKKGKTPGRKMAFLTVADATCTLDDLVVFPDEWKEYGGLFHPGNLVIVQGERQKDKEGLVVKKVWQAASSAA